MTRSGCLRRPSGALFLAAIVAVLGCGGGGTATPDGQPLESLSACVDAWKPLTQPAPFDVISPLVYAHGNVYFSTFSSQRNVIVPLATT